MDIASFEPKRRDTMTESAFRKFETTFAAALKGTIVVKVSDYFQRMNVKTFVNRFAEARLGWEKYQYRSVHIPYGTNLRVLSAQAGEGGVVIVRNKVVDEQKRLAVMQRMAEEAREERRAAEECVYTPTTLAPEILAMVKEDQEKDKEREERRLAMEKAFNGQG